MTGCTRVWGNPSITGLVDVKCPGETCQDLVDLPTGGRGHRERLGGNDMKASTSDKYQVPAKLIRYLCQWEKEEESMVMLIHAYGI